MFSEHLHCFFTSVVKYGKSQLQLCIASPEAFYDALVSSHVSYISLVGIHTGKSFTLLTIAVDHKSELCNNFDFLGISSY